MIKDKIVFDAADDADDAAADNEGLADEGFVVIQRDHLQI